MTELDMGSWYEPPDEVPYCDECAGDDEYDCPVCQDECDDYDGPHDTWQEWELDNE